ncbi:probable G-protein coupled receptor 25 [Chrysemys picta bellii]|uniref:probable G-protein coupled receptor 25 n=1 Tax=Chrysemys picta bellii TaxID=8478 RepID=UPI000388D53A|nr:probable G-protein coupled receptor 25 [Chrysemys picta bellii]
MTTEAWTVSYEASSAVYWDYNPLQDTCPPQDLPYACVYIPILYFITFFIGFIGNLLVIVLMAKKRGSKRLVDTFVLNLAVADLVFVLTLPLWAVSAAHGNKWYFGESLCKFSSFIISVNRSSSILFLMGMSVERYLVVMKRVDSKSTGTKNCLIIACGCIWAVSLLLGIPSLMYRKLSLSEDTTGELCEDEDSVAFQVLSLALLILTFLLPLGVILFCYCSISFKLLNHIRLGKGTKNSLQIIFTIIGAFICCWLPFNAFKAFLFFSSMFQGADLSCWALMALRRGLTISACLAFMNSCVNPIIYALMDRHFRHQVLPQRLRVCGAFQETRQTSGLSFSTTTESSLMFASRNKPSSPASIRPEM